jgi:hypothetical protein
VYKEFPCLADDFANRMENTVKPDGVDLIIVKLTRTIGWEPEHRLLSGT